ncbi:unnamed protein product [Agarophyton chilense]
MSAPGAAMNNPSDEIRGQCVKPFCRPVGITASMDIATVLRKACSWARRSVRSAAVVQQGQDLKTPIVNILEQNAQVMTQRVTADLDARLVYI